MSWFPSTGGCWDFIFQIQRRLELLFNRVFGGPPLQLLSFPLLGTSFIHSTTGVVSTFIALQWGVKFIWQFNALRWPWLLFHDLSEGWRGAEGNYNSSRGDPPGSALFSLSTLAEFSILFGDVVLILQRFTNKDFCSVGNYKPEQAKNFYFHRTKNRNEREPLSTTYSHMTRRDNRILWPLGDDHPPPSMLRKSLANKTCRNNSLFRFSY